MAPKANSPPAKAKPSPAQSVASSSSIRSSDANFSLPPAHDGAAASANGSTAIAPVEAKPATLAPPKKPTMTSRLGSMFGRGDASHHAHKDKHAEKQSQQQQNASSSGSAATTAENGRSPRIKPGMPSRMGSVSDKRSGSTSAASSLVERSKSFSAGGDKKKEAANASVNGPGRSRFWINEDGQHEHHLKSMKRQEKLSHMLREFMLGKKKEGHDEQPLSLMANWVDQVRSDKDKMASVEKGGPNSSLTLVQKYGKCQEIVGRGAFGIVRVAHKPDAKDPKREQLFAVKEFRQRPNESDRKYQKRLTAEFCISSSMQHPNVIQTFDLLKDDKGDFCEVMEYCAGGDLYTLILSATQLDVAEADCYFKQLMRGVEYMHEMGVAHRDLKPENLLLTSHGSIKVTDFGNGECFRMAWEKEAHMTAGLCGSGPYIAPEEYVDDEFDPRAVDIWACGVIYMAMRTGRHLWRVAQKDEDEFYTRYLKDRRQEEGYRPIEVLRRHKCRNVIYSILDPNPTRRITANQVLHSEWVKDIKVCKAGNEGF